MAWEEKDVFNPAAVVKDGLVHLIYRAEDTVGRFAGTSRIGLATSRDGLHFERRPQPVLFPTTMRFDDTSGKAAARIRGSSRPTMAGMY